LGANLAFYGGTSEEPVFDSDEEQALEIVDSYQSDLSSLLSDYLSKINKMVSEIKAEYSPKIQNAKSFWNNKLQLMIDSYYYSSELSKHLSDAERFFIDGSEELANIYNEAWSRASNSGMIEYTHSDWRGELPSFNESNTGCNPASTYVYDYASTFRKGTNLGQDKAKSRLYSLGYPEGNLDNCGYILTSRSSLTGDGKTANVYTIVYFSQSGDFKIKFKATGWNVAGITGFLYFYPKPVGELTNGNNNGFALLETCEKTEVGTFTPTDYVQASEVEDFGTGVWPQTTKSFMFNFNVPSAGDYMFEWVTKEGNKNGVMIGNYTIYYK
jgi:hypothetical protein